MLQQGTQREARKQDTVPQADLGDLWGKVIPLLPLAMAPTLIHLNKECYHRPSSW